MAKARKRPARAKGKPGKKGSVRTLARDLHAHAAELEAAGVNMMLRAQRLRNRAFDLTSTGAMTSGMAKDIVLHAAASLPGGKPYNPATPDSTKIDGGLVNSSGAPVPDGVWYFAQYCMTFGRFDTDKLVLWPEDVRTNGKTLGGFVKCVMNFYRKKP
ncbi:hypothetical protein ACSHT2_00180 [Bradyrhizobium sp. PUT101]|uniref:hypothetical protein n=1 Tax=Bradyrhizobium sp. PUT101 TaxID=3447427 RepID=UPI003F853774